jgi:ubiquinone/menaquinone biosynthesis C-methylase UbiE
MTSRAFDETAEGWDAVIEAYERVFAPFTKQFARDVARLYPPKKTDSVLEVAAGTGSLTEFLSEHAGRVLATDISPMMVQRIARSASGNVEAAVMDAEALAVPGASFDAIYCMFGVMFFSDRAKGLHEMVRALKRGGRCVLTTWNPRSGILRPLAEAVEKVMPDSPPAKALSEPPVLGTLQQVQRELEAAGLERIEVHEATHELRLRSREAYMNELLLANPNGVLMRNRVPPHVYDAVAREIDAALLAAVGDGEVAIDGVANIVCAYKA